MHNSTKELDDLLQDYFLYVTATINGEKGKTAEFWMKHVHLIHVYQEYSRDLCDGDLRDYISCLAKFTNMFFALNHLNYARWTVKYHNNLLTLEYSDPETFREYKYGMSSINRTTKPFSKNPIALTLEQTVSADTASQRTGNASMTNSISAGQRWAEYHHFLRTRFKSSKKGRHYRKSESFKHKQR